jgi:hypothetical protein
MMVLREKEAKRQESGGERENTGVSEPGGEHANPVHGKQNVVNHVGRGKLFISNFE